MCKCNSKCSCNITKLTVGEKGDNSLPYNSYVALLTQEDTNDPTRVILENSIGDIIFTYNSAGNYIGTLTGAFPVNKSFFMIQPIKEVTPTTISRLDDNSFEIDTVVSDDKLNNTAIEIRVYK